MRQRCVSKIIAGILAAQLSGWAAAPCYADSVAAGMRFQIAAGDALESLNEFGVQSGMQMLFVKKVVQGHPTAALEGRFQTREEALEKLLQGTGLTYEVVNDRTVAVREIKDEKPAAATERRHQEIRIAQADTEASSAQQSVIEDGRTQVGLEEIVVTAQKRAERLIDTPQSVSVVSSETLARLGATQLRDVVNTIPGLSLTTAGTGYSQISMRGVTVGGNVSPTVGIYVDEVPYGSGTPFALGPNLALDMGLFDIDRIEVLRGPQGTLYGASTMGGLLKYVTKSPITDGFGVDVRTGLATTHDGGESYYGAATVNAPIATDKAALRASGFYSRDGGYIDNVASGRKDVNRSDVYGARADLLLLPTEGLNVRITGVLQNISRDGEATANYDPAGEPITGSLDQLRRFPETFEQHFRLISGTVSYDLGPATLTSISSYQKTHSEVVFDFTSLYVDMFALCPCSAMGLPYDVSTERFTQEVRLASDGNQAVEWLFGGYYTREDSSLYVAFAPLDLTGHPAPNVFYTSLDPTDYEEYAAFGDVTWHATDKFDVTAGARYARNRLSYESTRSGSFGVSVPHVGSTDNILTYLLNARYHFSDRGMGYLRYATGYRPGGPNFALTDPTTGQPVGPSTFAADRLKSYEAGYKMESASRRFGIDVAAYFIDWSDIQTFVVRGLFAGIVNAPGGAEISGTELTLTARTGGLRTAAAFAYQHAELAEAEADLFALKGERLPNVPRISGSLTADYALPWSNSLQTSVGATVRYVGDRKTGFGTAYTLPDYTTLDLRTSFMLGSVGAQVYAHNLFDKRAQLSLDTSRGAFSIMQPRTIGISFTKNFQR